MSFSPKEHLRGVPWGKRISAFIYKNNCNFLLPAAFNLLGEVKTDVKTVASLLGHSGLKHVEVYTRAIDEKKAQALKGLPEINF